MAASWPQIRYNRHIAHRKAAHAHFAAKSLPILLAIGSA